MSAIPIRTGRCMTDDGRRWIVEVYPHNGRVKVIDIMSPTGQSEWVPPSELPDVIWDEAPNAAVPEPRL